MEALIFFLIISTTNLVLCDDNAAIENNAGYQVQEETGPENDQQAEGSQIIGHTYAQSVAGASLKNIQGVQQSHENAESLKYSDEGHLNRNGNVRYTYEVQNVHQQPQQQTVQYLHDVRHKPIVVNEGVRGQAYSHQEQQMGVQQYPVHPAQMYASQGSPSQQSYGNTIGYQSYVEHIPRAEEEEIKSALKENSLGDIKRLVPKSGISFKIYHSEKTPNVKVTQHEVETQPEVSTINTQAAHEEFHNSVNSVLHHRARVQAPVQQLQIQTHHQQGSQLEKQPQIYLQQNVNQQQIGNEHAVGNGLHDQQAVYYTQQEVSSPKPVVYTQPEVSTPRPVVYTQQEVSSSRPIVYTQHEVSSPRPVIYTQPEVISQRPPIEITSKGAVEPYKIHLRDEHVRATSNAEFNKNTIRHNQQRQQHSRKTFHKTVKQLKPENVQYQKELIEGVQKLAVSHNEGLGSFISHEGGEIFTGGLKGSIGGQDQGRIAHSQLLHSKTYQDSKTGQPILNRLSGSVVNLGTSAYSEYKTIQSNGFADNEPAKTQQSVNYGTQFEAQSTPHNFDHQKALEGSTTFDIKNAIGNTEGAEHQTGYITTTTEVHPNHFQKQQLTYNIPLMIDNTILKTPIEQQIKFGQVATIPQFAYQSQDLGGKFYQQPQFVWTTEHIKQGTELHQPLIKLHIPKEEIHYVKTQKVEIPGMISHQPLMVQQNAHYKPQEFIQHKKPQYQANLKLQQPVIIDWSLFKSKFPNVNINSLSTKPELVSYIQDPSKKIMPILVRKRKNRSNKEAGVVYGKATNRGPAKPNQRQEKNIHVNLVPSASNDVKQFDANAKTERKNEFSVSASYKVDRSFKSSP